MEGEGEAAALHHLTGACSGLAQRQCRRGAQDFPGARPAGQQAQRHAADATGQQCRPGGGQCQLEQLPRHQIFKSFPLGPGRGEAQVNAFQRIFREYRQFGRELENNNLVNLQFFLGYPVGFFTTRPNVDLAQLNASQWRTASFWHQSFLRNAGGVPVSMPWNEKITDALQTGQLDGLMVNLDSGDDIHAQRAAPYIQLSPSLWLGHVYLLVMNKDVWDSLDVKDRAAINRAAAMTQKRIGAVQDASLTAMAKKMAKEGAHVHYLTNSELNAWQAATGYQHVQAEWIAQQESKGINDVGELMQGVSAILNKTR